MLELPHPISIAKRVVPLTVHHYFPLGSTNIGDGLVARAIREAIPRHFGPCRFVDFPANDRYPGNDRVLGLRGDNLERTNAEAELVIVGGSNMLEARSRAATEFSAGSAGWGVFTDLDSIRQLRVPLLLLGMGTGSSFGRKVRPYLHPAVDEIRLLHQKAFAAAVRDLTTVEKLAEIGVKIECAGCPVTFLTDRPVHCVDDADLPLLVSFPPPRIVERAGGQSFMRSAMHYVQWLRERGTPLIVTLHDSEDLEPARRWAPKGVEIFCTNDLDSLIARFESCRGVIGFRLHAALLGLGLGKPVIPVGVDWRGIAFIETFGLGEFSVLATEPQPFAKMRLLTDRVLAGDAALIQPLDRGKSIFRERYERFLAEAARRFAGTGGRVTHES